MANAVPSKYGAALTGSDWVGLPLRVGHAPESGVVEDLSTDTDAVLVWLGGTSDVDLRYSDPDVEVPSRHRFTRASGMMDLLPRGTRLHRVTWHGEPSTCISVNFPPASLAALRSSEGTEGLDRTRGARFGVVDAHVVDLVRRLQAQAEGAVDYGAVYVQALSLALASYVSARYGPASPHEGAAPRAVLSSSHRRTVEAFIERELASNFSLVDLASLTGYCPDHFARLFKQAFDESPHQYVLSRRIERAKAMLKEGDRPIAEIAVACGFANQGHFSTAFKRRTGLTPAVYRRA